MNVAIEMHDSECLAVEVNESGHGFVLFDAYVHRTEGEPGVAAGEGGVQRIRMKVEQMTIEGVVGKLPAYVYHGSLTIGSSVQDNMVPFPAASSGPVRLRMMLSGDARIVTILGTGISVEPEGEFEYVEQFEPPSKPSTL